MQHFPHHYAVTATVAGSANVSLGSQGLKPIESAPPAEFGGPGDVWSPETLLAAAVADCFVLSFRAIATASKFEWNSLTCNVDAVLDRVDGVTRFTEIHEQVVLVVPAGTSEVKASKLLEKAEQVCLITNSLTAATSLETEIRVSE
ncbi:MAG: OsmC family protein [Pseudomonadota bacterium]